ncbi:type VI secretion system Vgr family protein [Xanthomonas rydalmerensis]|uniref:Type VI secretion system tip protein TssI/VgrG n=1 Tax=Xanthomonas rydalmerensis TaxID=3046274 RepID=A0ABZ0JSA0_9XANT|nr:type VI secretion system tip protein TssI/VgrG [Xanthomonas sp. DM-2023]WOS42714.1 type VI secretion system tip protein TssI/VgrG [Xanthomonas sp. DM-2023]WOS46900.1 type VI secretion system tip protein TssI/VgrG [Xanthomonas sp. DM-2023]WOS51079.1 type VI secretion system tip protein TssI/VgrG [Xanthomonas sp. DM-2023]WOS55260.1 type VI secretion system tip protein TssI/VgrG [Xanthomonas sp. DM-2023]WOS59442.1 type VI secretion system tip protein TssI/VgrG [Xanthomonas sp. DM-2023]
MTRRVTIQTPLGEQLQFRQLRGSEELSQLFSFDIDLLSEGRDIDPKALLGKTATVEIETEGGGKRYLDGLVTRFGMQGQDHRLYSYHLRLQPWLWVATRRQDFRIFQFKTVPQIVQEVLGCYGYPLQLKLTRAYRAWDYCVQYGESDFDFVSRLLEHEGAYYYFQHASGQHTLVIADDIVAGHEPLPGAAVIPFYPPEKSATADRENIHAWTLGEEIKPGRYYNDDYDFKKPRSDLSNMRQQPPGHAHDAYEIYEWPGGYVQHGDGEQYARVRLQEGLTGHSAVKGESRHRSLAPGYTFTLENYPRGDQNRQYLITGVTYHLHENPRTSSANSARPGETLKHNEEHGSFQKFSLTAQPTSLPYTPARKTPKPRTTGPQTAVVVGPAGEEIWTDEYGRIKVQFHWDRLGAMDENSSCWMRVATSWAGSGFGAISIPRIGHEVLVDFLNGDPDYPLVVGSVYNAANMPPWALPGNATQSGIKTKSSKGGAFGDGMKNGAGDANAIRFEDKKGAEQLWLHAQKDQLTEVENDEDKWVGQDRRKTIDRDETNVIHRDRTETVDRNEKITVHGWRTEEVDGDETITIHSNRKERVDHNETISIGDNRDEMVGINEDIRIGKNRSKTVGRSETDSISKNWTTTVGLLKTETIGVGCIQTTGVFKMANVGVAYNLNVGITMMTNVGMNRSDTIGMEHTHTAGKKYALTVGGGGGSAAAGAVSKNITAPSGGSEGKGGSSLVMDETSITLKVGKSVLEMKDDGTVSVNGKLIQITADGDNVVIQGEDIHLN